MATPITAQQPNDMTTKAVSSEGENVLEIHALTLRIQDLNQRVDWWNAAMLWALAVAVLVAVAVVITTSMSLRRSKQLSEAQAELIRAKDAQIALDLRGKDVRIAELGETAERERLARIELEEALAWRRLTKEQEVAIGKSLKRFEGQRGQMLYNAGDREGAVFAGEIWLALKAAQWKMFAPGTIISGMRLGNTDMPKTPANETEAVGVLVSPSDDESSRQAAAALVTELTKLGFNCLVSEPHSKGKTGDIQVLVDTRPLGPQGAAKLRAEEKHRHK